MSDGRGEEEEKGCKNNIQFIIITKLNRKSNLHIIINPITLII